MNNKLSKFHFALLALSSLISTELFALNSNGIVKIRSANSCIRFTTKSPGL